MIRAWGWIKKRWYRRQARRAIWFLRYLDRCLAEVGMGRAKAKQFWEDFYKHPQARMMALDQLAVLNKIKIRRANETKMGKLAQSVLAANRRLEAEVRDLRELNKANAKLAQHTSPGDDPGTPKEVTREVPEAI
jgi:hypothetical protein